MSKQFVEKVRKSELSLRPVLPLGLPIGLGHVGSIADDGAFHHRGTARSILGLNSLGGELRRQDSPLRISVTSGRNVGVNFGASAKTDGPLAQFARLSGKASITFGSESSFFLAVDGLRIRQLALVHRVGVARRLTVILAAERSTTVLLKASGRAAMAASTSADLASGFTFVAATKAVTQLTGGRELAAFYNAYRVKDPWYAAPRVEQYRLALPFGTELDRYPDHITRVADPAEAFASV